MMKSHRNRHLFGIITWVLSLLAHSNQATELELLLPADDELFLTGNSYEIKWPPREGGTTNLSLMRMATGSDVGGLILEIASNVPLSSGQYKWTIPPGLDINNVHFPPWAILSNSERARILSDAFWANDVPMYKRDDGNSSGKTTRWPNGSSDDNVSTRTSSIEVSGDSTTSPVSISWITTIAQPSDSTMISEVKFLTTIPGNSSISIPMPASWVATITSFSISPTHPTLLATPTSIPMANNVKRNHMPMIVGIIVGVLGLFVMATVFIIIRHRDKDEKPLTLPWKMRDKNALELQTTANLHEMEGPGKFELDVTSMKVKVCELEGRSIKKPVPIDFGG